MTYPIKDYAVLSHDYDIVSHTTIFDYYHTIYEVPQISNLLPHNYEMNKS